MMIRDIVNIIVLIFVSGVFIGIVKHFMAKTEEEIKEIKHLLNNHISTVLKDITEIKEKVAYIEGIINGKIDKKV